MNEFRLKPGEITVIGNLTIGNYSTQTKWYIVHTKAEKTLVANVKTPEHPVQRTLEEPEPYRSDFI